MQPPSRCAVRRPLSLGPAWPWIGHLSTPAESHGTPPAAAPRRSRSRSRRASIRTTPFSALDYFASQGSGAKVHRRNGMSL